MHNCTSRGEGQKLFDWCRKKKKFRIAHPRFISTLNSYWKHLTGHCDDYVGFDF